MFAVPPPMNHRTNLPQRSDSLGAVKTAPFAQIEEELRDVKRVHMQGQEEDLRMALSRTISRVEELSFMLKDAIKAQTDLHTELTLAKSNLQLALANNEMLEDALKRDGGHSKDVGWRRWSAKEQRERELADSRRQSMESNASQPEPNAPSPVAPSPLPATAEGRFFKFRFGNQSVPVAGSPRIPSSATPTSTSTVNGASAAAHLTSASLPSLVPTRDKEKELEEILAQLEKERKAHKAAQAAKEQLEAELESLSQALFEEANKMVAAERMKLAEAEEELKEARAEKDALRSALKLVEHQRIEAESREASPLPGYSFPASSSSTSVNHSHKRSSSSAIAIKSLPSSQPSSAQASPQSMVRILSEPASSSTTRAPAPPPLELPEVGLSLDGTADSSPSETKEQSEQRSVDEEDAEQTAVEPGHASESLSPPEVSVTGASPTAQSPSPGQFGFSSGRPLTYFDTEESPWADARSSTPVTAAF
ncbi:hypothetical protein PsYK624_090030 [Phanerochaete sordida]|uniref:GDP/GTP exchange factor Sec2 N-terminal domain-containing protein n=1 Tax=Phanerochaete sordida TaxID=48140 RepID=A0A9P3LF14_9APHY|nr:hypothetical protein PsYK624_090030 [Phanerochaete sordida]